MTWKSFIRFFQRTAFTSKRIHFCETSIPLLHPHLALEVLALAWGLVIKSSLLLCRYCVVLLTAEATKSSKPFEAFLSFALANTQDTVRFVHIYSSRQQEFAKTLLPDSDSFQGKSAVSHGFSLIPSSSQSTWHLNLFPSFLGVLNTKTRKPRNPQACFESLLLKQSLTLVSSHPRFSALGHPRKHLSCE